jgi:hypothetical protein
MTRNVQEVLGVGEKLDREFAIVILSTLCSFICILQYNFWPVQYSFVIWLYQVQKSVWFQQIMLPDESDRAVAFCYVPSFDGSLSV